MKEIIHISVESNLNVPMGQTVTPKSAIVLTTDYVSNLVYESGQLKYILNPEGYAVRKRNGDYSYNYYLKDHLGNNRVVLEIDRVNSLVNQATDYYPFGMPYADSQYPERQPYKFGGKEYDEMHGLNWYDFHARAYNGILGHFPTIPDPLAEKYYWISPYAFCLNNPVRYTDPTGKFPVETIWDIGNVLYDIGAAVVNHIKGNHSTAMSNWTDLGMDAAAMVIPYVPAGATKVLKAADAAADVATTAKTMDKAATARGVKNETKVLEDMNVPKNNKIYTARDPKTGQQINTKPDGMDNTKIVEVKDTKTVNNTQQIRTEREVAKQQGKDFKIVTGEKTHTPRNISESEIIRRKDIGPQ